jgi:hypothetical protein
MRNRPTCLNVLESLPDAFHNFELTFDEVRNGSSGQKRPRAASPTGQAAELIFSLRRNPHGQCSRCRHVGSDHVQLYTLAYNSIQHNSSRIGKDASCTETPRQARVSSRRITRLPPCALRASAELKRALAREASKGGSPLMRPIPHRRAAAMLPPSTVVTSPVVLSSSAWCRNACATSSAVTSRPSRLPAM